MNLFRISKFGFPFFSHSTSHATTATGAAWMNTARWGVGGWGVLLAVTALLVLFRVAGPSDIYDNDQPMVLAHSVDVAANGRWLLQQEPDGALATKPPMYPWLGGLSIRLTGSTAEWVLKLPSLLAAAVTGACVWLIARRLWHGAGRRTATLNACLAAAVWTANLHVFKLMYTARSDMLLAMWLSLALLATLRQREAWRGGCRGGWARGRGRERNPPGDDQVEGPPPQRLPRRRWIGLFWLALAAGLLTKGPAALIAVAFWIGLVAWDRSWRRCRPGWQIIAAVAAVGLTGAWFVAAVHAYPQWWHTLHHELVDRFADGAQTHRSYTPWMVPLYFLERWLPWSLLVGVGGAAGIAWWTSQRPGSSRALSAHTRSQASWARHASVASYDWTYDWTYGWAYGWVGLTLGAYLFQKGVRGDYVLPAYTAGAVLVVAVLDRARRCGDAVRVAAHLVLGAVGLLGLACPLLAWVGSQRGEVLWQPTPLVPREWSGVLDQLGSGQWVEPAMMIFAATVAAGAGGITLMRIHRRRYLAGGFAACVVMAGVAGLYQGGWSAAAKSRTGDQLHLLVDAAQAVSRREGMPLVFYQVGYTPVQAMLGTNRAMDARAWERTKAWMTAKPRQAADAMGGGGGGKGSGRRKGKGRGREGRGGVVLLTSAKTWNRIALKPKRGRESRATVLLATPKLPESNVALRLVRLGH